MTPIAQSPHARDEQVRERIPRIPARGFSALGLTPQRTLLSRRHLSRPAFTLLEVVLAAVLGMLVIAGSLALFSAMDRAKRMQAARLEANVERQLAHRTIQQALRTLDMDSTPEPKDDELKTKIEDDIADAQSGNQERREDTAVMRFALQYDLSKRSALGEAMQTLDLTLSTPPIHALTRSTDMQRQEDDQLRQLSLSRDRSTNVWNSKSLNVGLTSGKGSLGSSKAGSSSRERTPESSSARSDRLRSGASGLGATDPNEDRINSLAGQSIEPPRAPGVRGIFEFRPEDDAKVLARGSANGGGVWALWWKQLPVEEDADDGADPEDSSAALTAPSATLGKTGSDAAAASDTGKLKQDTQRQRERSRRIQLLELARASRSDMPEVKLLSGVTSAQWQVFRRRKMVSKMAAMHAKELPAYVNFKFETIEGRHDDWLFEVAWSYGQEPGTVMAVNDPLGAPFDPAADALATALAAATAAAGGTGGTTATGGVAGDGPVASAGGKPAHPIPGGGGGGGTVTGGNGRPIVITLPGGGVITIPAGAVPGGSR